MNSVQKKCCRTCANLAQFPKKNHYGDIDYFCLSTGYYCSGVDRNISEVKRYSPGGKELKCEWKGKKK